MAGNNGSHPRFTRPRCPTCDGYLFLEWEYGGMLLRDYHYYWSCINCGRPYELSKTEQEVLGLARSGTRIPVLV